MSGDTVSLVADTLFRSGCLKFGSFRIKFGASSPYYIDFAGLLSHPKKLYKIAEAVAATVEEIAAEARVDRLASIELRGALLLPSIAVATNLPCVVRGKRRRPMASPAESSAKSPKANAYCSLMTWSVRACPNLRA